MRFLHKTIFMITNGAFYETVFESDPKILSLFFYSMLNLLPLAAAFLYFGFVKAGMVVLGVLAVLFAIVFLLIRRDASHR